RKMEVSFLQLDSAGGFYLAKDTVDMQYIEKEDTRRRRRAREEENDQPPPVPQFTWSTNISSSGFDLNRDVWFTAPQPLASIDPASIILYLSDDSLNSPLPFRMFQDTSMWRTHRISFLWEEETSYTLRIDSAAA